MNTMCVQGLSASRKLYQFLVLFYPSEYRRTYGPWMVQLFCDQYRAAMLAGQPAGLVCFWLHTLADLASSALREHVEHFKRGRMGKNNSDLPEPGDHHQRVVSRVLKGLMILLLIAIGYVSYFFFFGGGSPVKGLILGSLIVAAYVIFRSRWKSIARGWGHWMSLIAGFVILAVLLVLAVILIETQVVTPFPIPSEIDFVLTIAFLFLPAIGVVYAALLYTIGMRQVQERVAQNPAVGKGTFWERLFVGRMSSDTFLLSALLLGVLAFDLYWLAVWDSTTDALDVLWIIIPLLASIFAGVWIASQLPWKIKWSGFCYGLLVTGLIVGVFYLGKQVNSRRLTESRATRITQAIEAYSAREGRYPQQLSQLTPRYLLTIPAPVVIQGGDWCYRAGADYFRLGYLDRDHWSSPIVFGRMASAQGNSPLKEDVCQPTIDRLRTKHGWDLLLKQYGKPTPTPDLGE